MAKSKNGKSKAPREASTYRHPEADSPLRPDVGTQPQFKKRKPPATYRYDSSLSPELNWDGQNHARETGEALIREILEAKSVEDAKRAAERLKAISGPFLNWAGKAERLSFDVPTLPLFVHERLSTKGIIETLKGHKLDPQLGFDLFGDPGRSITDQVLKAYEYRDKWVNRIILGDSLAVMNSLLHYEGLGGQVQMIYIDPPYGVKFGSNFQPFVRKRDVSANDDEDMTREPEMVKAYRDTWELGLHSYLSYMRDRLLLARELLASSGSVFVQIGDQNVHTVRELLDETFGAENFCALITFRTSVPLTSVGLGAVSDYLIWYSKDKTRYKFRDLFVDRETGEKSRYSGVELPDGTRRSLSVDEKLRYDLLPKGSRPYADMDLASSGYTPSCIYDFEYNGKVYRTSSGKNWKTTKEGMQRLADAGRLTDSGKTIRYIIYFDDFPVTKLTNFWQDTTGELEKQYVVQTHTKLVQRCLLMTTDPGDLVLDPTCGSGTTAYVAEHWGRRWITIDTSRVPLALARQRPLTATFPYYQLRDEARGPAGGFV
jgi:adenine-specific DNA-methyltransferase